MRSLALLTFSWMGCLLVQAGSPDSTYGKTVRPLLETYCFGCHGPKTQKAKLRLDTLPSDLKDGAFTNNAAIETWHDVLNKLNAGEMPPAKKAQPNAEQLATVVDWLTGELATVKARQRSTGGRAVLRRMTRYEYANTLRDLLGIDGRFGEDLPPESTSRDGFQNNGATLGMSAIQLEYYLSTARAALRRTIFTGPRPQTFEQFATKSETAKKRKPAPTGNRLEPGGLFILRAKEFPRVGDVRVRVRARAETPAGAPFPRLRVRIGVRSDVKSFSEILGEADLEATGKEATTLEFRGRIEEFPLPGHNPKFPGLVVSVWHVDDDASPNGKKKKNKKPKKKNKKRKGKNAVVLEEPVKPTTDPLVFIESVRFEGPIFDAWPPSRHTRILFDSPSKGDEPKYAREVVTRFTRRAYRRKADTAEIDILLSLFTKVRPRCDTFEEAIRETLAMALVSPSFLYLVEPRRDEEKRRRLTNDELAVRLSYFLWSTMPDAELFALADAGKLHDGDQLEGKVLAMLKSPRSRQFVEHFVGQWLDLSGLDRVAVNPEYYPDFDERLKADMRSETLAFFAEILAKDLSALELIDSEFTMVNRRLAKHYGISPPRGSRFERVALGPSDHRGGILTHGGILLVNSNGEDSHPIKRGVWLRDRLLDDPPAPPPPDVPELDSEEPDFAKLPLKEQLELHRQKPACNACHRGIDPWGIPFENFDAIGRWRTEVQGPVKKRRRKPMPVVTSSTLPDGSKLSGLDALKSHLAGKERHRFARALVRKLLAYALARSLEIGDDASVDSLTQEFEASGFKLSDLIVRIAQSETFQTR